MSERSELARTPPGASIARAGEILEKAGAVSASSFRNHARLFGGGDPIKRVLVSPDNGRNWQEAKLGQDLGRYSFREWKLGLTLASGRHALRVRAETAGGETQPMEPRWQPAGYMRNVVETTNVEAV